MDSQTAISIITPVYNGLPYIRECVESVLNQELQEWEMLISDDGSTDGSREYLHTLTDPRIKVFMQEKNLGIFGNLNFIFSKASAPVSQILCQDDYFLIPKSLTKIVDYWINCSENIGFVRFNHESNIRCRLTAFENKFLPEVVSPKNSALFFFIFGNIPGNLSNVSLRTRIVGEVGGFDTGFPYAGDFDFWSRANNQFAMGIQKESVTHIRRHPGVASISLNRKGELISQKGRIIDRLYSNIKKQNIWNEKFLKFHGTLNYDSLQRDVGLKLLLRGNGGYLKELDRVSDDLKFIVNRPLRWILYFFTIGGRIGRASTAKALTIYMQS